MDLKDIKAIIDLMKKNSLSEFELERADFKIKLKRGAGGMGEEGSAPIYHQTLVAPIPQPLNSAVPTAAAAAVALAAIAETEISSPMIGTFYRAPSPESANYVDVGSEVNADTVVCLIEAMKVMNEIKAETKGIITQILVENAKPVEFGQPMFKLRPV